MINFAVRPALLTILLCLVAGLGPGCTASKIKKPVTGDRVYTEYSAAARTAYSQGRLDEAVNYYTLAHQRARRTARPKAIANSALNLAACLIELQQYDRARPFLTEACLELTRQGLPIARCFFAPGKSRLSRG